MFLLGTMLQTAAEGKKRVLEATSRESGAIQQEEKERI